MMRSTRHTARRLCTPARSCPRTRNRRGYDCGVAGKVVMRLHVSFRSYILNGARVRMGVSESSHAGVSVYRRFVSVFVCFLWVCGEGAGRAAGRTY